MRRHESTTRPERSLGLHSAVEAEYAELRRLAFTLLRHRPERDARRTSLVHEAYVRLAGSDPTYRERGHFLAVATRTMRHVLVDEARRRVAVTSAPETLVADTGGTSPEFAVAHEVLALDRALGRLRQASPRAAQVVEMRFFGGASSAEIAEALDVSVPTVKRDWRTARAWLLRAVS